MAEQILKGSCLCGNVTYTAVGTAVRFYHCHCGRCRKSTGTGHATNVFVEGRLTWDSGEEMIASYKVPEAERFSNRFCTTCGARLPRFIEDLGAVFIPAGSLDVDPGIKPQARIFMDSSTSWSCATDDLPQFAGRPAP